MYVLDTNILKLYFEQPQNHPDLAQHIRDADARRSLYITIVNAQEILAHAVNVIKDRPNQKERELLRLYDDLFKLITFLKRFSILPFDKAAYDQFVAIGKVQISIGTRDRRIAAIALANDATIVTANRQRFDLVPKLKVENRAVSSSQPSTQE